MDAARLRSYEVALVARMADSGRSLGDVARELGVPSKLARRSSARLRGQGWVAADGLLAGDGLAAGREAVARLRAGIAADSAQGATFYGLLEQLVARGIRSPPEAERRRPNVRDMVSAALLDVDWRLERGRRQRNRDERARLREVRWLLQRAMRELHGEAVPAERLSPHLGRHSHDWPDASGTRPRLPGPVGPFAPSDLSMDASRVYKQTLGDDPG